MNKFFFLKGGAESVFFDTAKLLEEKGHEVIFFSMKHPSNFQCNYEKYFLSEVEFEDKTPIINKIKSAGRILYSFEARRKIEKLIRKEKPDIAHLHNIHHQISPSILHVLKKYNIPVVMTLHDYKLVCPAYTLFSNGKICECCKNKKYYWCLIKKCSKNSYLKSLLNTIEMYLHHHILNIYKLIDIFISPSKFLKNKILEMGFKGKIFYLPNFLKVQSIEPHYQWEEDSITYFGRLSYEKGILSVLPAIKGINIKFKLIGDGPLINQIKEKVEKESLTNIIILGYKSDYELREEIRKTMFIIQPSLWYENNPRSLIESFALGKPVIGAKIGGIPELIQDGETGLLFEPGNSEDLREKILFLLNNPEKIKEMGKKARELIEKKFNPENHYKNLIEIYRTAIKNYE